MKPYGRIKNVKGSGSWKKDYNIRPKKIYVNWWENIIKLSSRTTIKNIYKKDIFDELNEDDIL